MTSLRFHIRDRSFRPGRGRPVSPGPTRRPAGPRCGQIDEANRRKFRRVGAPPGPAQRRDLPSRFRPAEYALASRETWGAGGGRRPANRGGWDARGASPAARRSGPGRVAHTRRGGTTTPPHPHPLPNISACITHRRSGSMEPRRFHR